MLDATRRLRYVPAPQKTFQIGHLPQVRIATVIPQCENEYLSSIQAYTEARYKELRFYGVEGTTVFCSNPTSLEEIENKIDKLVSEGVSGIVYYLSHVIPENKIKELAKKKIPVILCARDAPESGRLAFVGSDLEKAGRLAGNLIRLISNNHMKLGIIDDMISSHISQRIDSFHKYLETYVPNVEIVSEIAVDSSDDFDGFSAAKDMITEHPDIDIIYCPSVAVYGVSRFLEKIPAEHRPKLVCHCQGSRARKMLCKGIITAAICRNSMEHAVMTIDILFNYLLLDIKPEQEVYHTPLQIMLAENANW